MTRTNTIGAQALSDEQLDAALPPDVQRSARGHQKRWRAYARTVLALAGREQAGAVAAKLEAIEHFAAYIQRTLDSEDFTAAKVPGLKDGLLYNACERAIWIQNAVKGLRILAAPGAAIAAREQEAKPAKMYAECRQCDGCDHIGINDSNDTASACNSCDWRGPYQSEDKCPQCERTGTMTAACPECGDRYRFLADADLPMPASRSEAPAASAGLPAMPDLRYHAEYRRGFANCLSEIQRMRTAPEQSATKEQP